MATLEREPESFTAGSSVRFDKSLPDYPASEWSLTYYFQGAQNLTVVAGESGNKFSVSIAAATTAPLPAGTYWWSGRVTNGTTGEVYDLDQVQCQVLPNPETATPPVDRISHCRRALALIEAAIEGRLPRQEESYQIQFGNGSARQLSLLSPTELIKAREYYLGQVRNEEEAARIAAGLGSRRNILTRFVC